MLLAIVLVGALGISGTAYASEKDSAPSDKELLLGLVYGNGPVAEKLGITQERPTEVDKQVYVKSLNESVDGLLSDPKFKDETDSALDQIRSDDPRVVEAGIDALGTVVVDQVEANVDKDPELKAEVESAKKSDRVEPQCGAAVVCVAYAAAAVHNTVVLTGLAAVVVGGALWAGVWKWVGNESELSPQMASKDTSAKREILISDIVDIS